jgi:acyl-CoA thioester hydrolase
VISLTAERRIRVPFHDVDAMEVVWHGHYIKYFEDARSHLLGSFNYDYPQMKESGYLWPVVQCQLKYVKPATYGQEIVVRATLAEYQNRLRIRYLITDCISGKRLTTGETIQVAVDAATGELQLVSPAPLLRRVEQATGAGQ